MLYVEPKSMPYSVKIPYSHDRVDEKLVEWVEANIPDNVNWTIRWLGDCHVFYFDNADTAVMFKLVANQ
jgi:hypothetical protein